VLTINKTRWGSKEKLIESCECLCTCGDAGAVAADQVGAVTSWSSAEERPSRTSPRSDALVHRLAGVQTLPTHTDEPPTPHQGPDAHQGQATEPAGHVPRRPPSDVLRLERLPRHREFPSPAARVTEDLSTILRQFTHLLSSYSQKKVKSKVKLGYIIVRSKA